MQMQKKEGEQKRQEKREAKVTPEDTAQHMRLILSGMLVLEGRDRSLIMLWSRDAKLSSSQASLS